MLVWVVIVGWPQLQAAAGVLRSADHTRLLLALGCQLAALALLSLSYRAALATAGVRVAYVDAGGVALRAGAVSRLLPGGGAAAALFAVHRLRQGGVPHGPAVAGVAVNAVVTMSMLLAVVAVAAGGALSATAVPVVLWIFAATVVIATAMRHRLRRHVAAITARLARWAPLAVGAAALDALAGGPVRVRQLSAAGACAAAAWMFELGGLWLAVAAVAQPLPLSAVALGLGAANAATAVPHTPGGVGVVEAAMTAAFVAAGLDAASALGGVLAYRAVGFWLPVALGSGLLAVDRVGRLRMRPCEIRAVAK